MIRKKDLGLSFLEFCLSLPIILIFSLSVIDVYRSMYSYTIVRSAARTIAEKATRIDSQNDSVDNFTKTNHYIWYKNKWASEAKKNRLRKVIPGTYIEGTTPADCLGLEYDESCDKSFASSDGNYSEVNYEPDLEKIIENFGKREISAGLASAVFDCDANTLNCVNIQSKYNNENDPQVDISISYQTPVYILGFLNDTKTLKVSSSFSKILESTMKTDKPNAFIGEDF